MSEPMFRHCLCPECGFVWWHIIPSDRIVCPRCSVELTVVFCISDEAALEGQA